jgi:oligopeptide/dipeptide ABC transporter ATP-binding protein
VQAILEVHGLKKHFPMARGLFKRVGGWVHAVDGVSFAVAPGESFGLVGESGCGKSTLGKTILGICRPTAGAVRFRGRVISGLPKAQARQVRREIQYVYQDPGASLAPGGRWAAACGSPCECTRGCPGRRSGNGWRLALARTLVLNPRLIIFDEPTAGLDVSVQATILRLFKDLQARFALTYLFISHDLGIVRLMCDRVAVMYLGVIVESGPTEAIFRAPRHPYTRALLAAVPKPEVGPWEGAVLPGEPPRPEAVPSGCRFRLRCPYAQPEPCAGGEPALAEVEPGHLVACHFARDGPPTRAGAQVSMSQDLSR